MNIVNESGLKHGWIVGRVPPHELSATLFVKGTFRLQPGAAATPLPEGEQQELAGDVHADDDPENLLLYPSDFALLKPRADVMLKARCHPPGGKPIGVCRVAFHVGSWSKALGVIGDRFWKPGLFGSSMEEPRPFTEMDLGWDRSFGGPGFDRNPLGRGAHDLPFPDGTRRRPLPNVEWPDRLIRTAGEHPEPAGFGPQPLTWPQRMSKAGTYDKKWLKENWPGFPRDADWTLFNAAPEDQQLRAYLRGDEPLRFENLHPGNARYESRLPALRVRWFVDEDAGEQMRFHEVPLHLDTLWADLTTETLVLVWRGVTPIRTKQMKEVARHYIVKEPLDTAPLPERDYLARLDRLEQEEQEERRKPVVPFVGLKLPPVPEPSTDWVKDAEAEVAKLQKEWKDGLAAEAARHKELHAKLAGMGVALPKPPVGTGPKDPFQAALGAYERLQKMNPAAAALFPKPKAADFKFDPPPPLPAEPMPPLEAPPRWTREKAVAHAGQKGSFADQDLAGLDLSGLDLSHLDFEGAVLREAVLTGSRLNGTKLARASLSGAQLGGADLTSADLSQADLAGAVLAEALLTKARITEADFSGAQASKAVFTSVSGSGALFLEAVLEECRFSEADLTGAEFDGATLTGADFTKAKLRGASFVKAKAPGLVLVEADLTKLSASAASMPGLRATNVRARESIWEAADLSGADFTRAELDRANFEAAKLRSAKFPAAGLREARLPEADLEGADLRGANGFRATFEGANLRNARLDGANLYESELYQARPAGATFEGTNLKGTKLA
jgi:uncharacterized protein YjbI with pentapeptide repeats